MLGPGRVGCYNHGLIFHGDPISASRLLAGPPLVRRRPRSLLSPPRSQHSRRLLRAARCAVLARLHKLPPFVSPAHSSLCARNTLFGPSLHSTDVLRSVCVLVLTSLPPKLHGWSGCVIVTASRAPHRHSRCAARRHPREPPARFGALVSAKLVVANAAHASPSWAHHDSRAAAQRGRRCLGLHAVRRLSRGRVGVRAARERSTGLLGGAFGALVPPRVPPQPRLRAAL